MRVVVSSVVLAVLTGSALADPAADVELRYAAPTECPARDVAEAQIRDRAPTVRFVDGASRVFDIAIATSDTGYAGILVVDGGEGRQLAARRCDDLVTALALVVAIAIDPQAALGGEPAPAPPPPPSPPAPEPARVPTRYELAATLGYGVGVTPDPLLAGGIEIRASRRQWSLGLAMLGGRDSTTSEMATARFTWIATRPSLCWITPVGFVLAACAQGEVGMMRAEGDDIVFARSLTRLWLAVGAHVRVQWPSRGRVFGEAELGASIPFLRDRYRFNPGTEIHATGALIGWANLGGGIRF